MFGNTIWSLIAYILSNIRLFLVHFCVVDFIFRCNFWLFDRSIESVDLLNDENKTYIAFTTTPTTTTNYSLFVQKVVFFLRTLNKIVVFSHLQINFESIKP